jgi:hypothetical protein
MRTAAILFLLCLPAFGQGCVGVMHPNYDTYSTQTIDSNDNIVSTVVVEGSTSVGQSSTCHLGSVTHLPGVSNVINGQGGWVYGSRVSPTTYISLSNPQDIIGVPGIVYVDNFSASVDCSAVGFIFASSFSINIRIATTNYHFTGLEGISCVYLIDCGEPNQGNPTCNQSPVFANLINGGCTPYMHVHYLVVNDHCSFVGRADRDTIKSFCD